MFAHLRHTHLHFLLLNCFAIWHPQVRCPTAGSSLLLPSPSNGNAPPLTSILLHIVEVRYFPYDHWLQVVRWRLFWWLYCGSPALPLKCGRFFELYSCSGYIWIYVLSLRRPNNGLPSYFWRLCIMTLSLQGSYMALIQPHLSSNSSSWDQTKSSSQKLGQSYGFSKLPYSSAGPAPSRCSQHSSLTMWDALRVLYGT